jgi:hypothetical protein
MIGGYVCQIPGADASTAAWHAAVQLGLAAFVVVAGAVFLALAIVTFRRPVAGRPTALRAGAHRRPGP